MAYKYLNDDGLKAYTKKVKGALKDLHSTIAISSENTTESMAQNVKNIADYVEKAKAAGIKDVDGMAVTCIIDDDYSAVGYLYRESEFVGIMLYDDNSLYYVSIVNGEYNKNAIILEGETDQVTSFMLVQGARRPIILTPDTTEIDEETYQKLLSDNVDVLLKDASGNIYRLTAKYEDDTTLYLYFTCITLQGTTAQDIYMFGFNGTITKNSPHTCNIVLNLEDSITVYLDEAGYLNKSTLNPVLQLIDLTGTDADRKARLDQFEANWKALTGASNLTGARFVGQVTMENGADTQMMLNLDIDYNYSGISMTDSGETKFKKIVVSPADGSVTSVPLFSHLEAVILRSGSDSGVLNANKAAIEAYIGNIENLGIDPDSGYIIPIQFIDGTQDYYGILFYRNDTSYLNGIVSTELGNSYCNFTIDRSDGSAEVDLMERLIIEADLFPINTQLKYIETCVKFTEISSSNKSKLDGYLREVPNATVMHCTYKDVYAGTLYKINSDWYGLLVKNTNNPADNVNIKLSADGTIITSNSAQ